MTVTLSAPTARALSACGGALPSGRASTWGPRLT